MRLLLTAAALAYAPCLIAQIQAVDTPVPKPMVMPHGPAQRPRTRQAAPGKAKPANVPPTTPVVTLEGVCRATPVKGGVCRTVITREDLDRFVSALEPDVSEAARGRVAAQYARTVAFSALAEQQGLAQDPTLVKEIDAELRLVRERILAAAYLKNLQSQTTTSDGESEIQKYYDEHRDQYAQAQVRRLAAPLAAPTEGGRPLDRSAVKTEMEALRSRAVAGEDLNQLQQEAYKHLHIQAPPPPVNVQTLRRLGLQGDEAKAFDLNPGEISAVLDLPAAFAIVKMESKDTAPLDSVRQEIDAALGRDRMQIELSKATRKISAQFNLPYLGLSSQPDTFGPAATSPAASLGSLRRTSGAARP
jgi:hypothetical protein